MLSRRQFLVVSGSIVAGSSLARAASLDGLQPLSEPTLDLINLKDGVWAVLGSGGNSMILRTGDGAVLVDTKLPDAANLLHRRVADLAGEGPALVVNTHHHGDHVGGNWRFDDATILAHQNVKPRLKATIDDWLRPAELRRAKSLEKSRPERAEAIRREASGWTVDDFAADETFDREHEIKRGTRTIRLIHVGPAHTDNDVLVFLPEANVLHTGDLVFHRIHPYMDTSAQSNSAGWRDALRKALELTDADTVVIPGHGNITDRGGIEAQIRYFDDLEAAVRDAVQRGVDREAIAELRVPGYADYQGDRLGANLRTLHDEITRGG